MRHIPSRRALVLGGGAVAPLTGATWASDGAGRAYNTPTLGSELLTDGGLENWASATNLTSWTEDITGLSTVNREASIINGGTYAARFDVNGTSYVYIYQNSVLTSGKWYQIGGALRNDGSTRTIYVQLGTAQIIFPGLTQSYAAYRASGRANGTPIYFFRLSAVTHSLYLDDLTCKELSVPTLHAATLGTSATQNPAARINALTTGTQAGIFACVDNPANPQNGIYAYHDGTGVTLDKLVAGIWSNPIPRVTVAFASDAQLSLVPLGGNQWQLFCAGTQRGSTVTISDASILAGRYYGLFSTYSGNTFSEFTLDGKRVEFGF